MQRHLSGGPTIIAALLAADRSLPLATPDRDAAEAPARDVLCLLAGLGRDVPRLSEPPRP